MFLVRRFTLICALAALFGAGVAKLSSDTGSQGLSARMDARALCAQPTAPGCAAILSK